MSDIDDIPQPDQIEGAPHPRDTITLFGQPKAEADFLTAFASNHLHHSWLITGPKGIGKATLAWNITRFLLSQDAGGMFDTPTDTLHIPPDDPVFRRVAALSEPGVFLCRRPWDPKTNRLKKNITVDEVRKLKSFFTLSAADGGWRIAIVDAADEMNISAENALLKVLEEPPAKTIIMLISHQPAKLLPTIRSRCRELRCAPLLPDALTHAMEQAGFPIEGDAHALNQLSNGSAGEAIDLLAHDGIPLYAEILSLMATAPRMNRPRIAQLGNTCAGKGTEARYDMTIRLTMLALSRLALNGAKGTENPINGEGELAARLSTNPQQAREWAALVQELSARISHARAVNLDPAQVILDTFLSIDTAAGRALRLTA